jgi:ABC-type multidrug transport system ATPase subunit/pSer/pThr/pTyr-binding forkhead associated (FHA) protein
VADGLRSASPSASGEEATTSGASILYAGRRYPVPGSGLTVGRAEDNAVVLDDERASRSHARVSPQGSGVFVVEDLGSRHGTLVNGEPIGSEPRELTSGDRLQIGESGLRFLTGDETTMAGRQVSIATTQTVRFTGQRMSIGRDESNDVVLDDPNVSRFHAEVLAGEGTTEVVDLSSRNGTRLDGELVERAPLKPGSEIGIGAFGIRFDGTSLMARDERGRLRLQADEISITVKGREILAPTALAIEPGEMVAIIGESGAGKSTLLKAIAGVSRISSGQVSINGEPLASRLTDTGYVPQDDIVHPLLRVTEALGYAAQLRLPGDTSAQEIDAAVQRVVRELSLESNADQLIRSLSGGQRKRTAVATELLARPSLLFLDEPTTGMDPGLESKMMRLFRELAHESRALVLVTHATKNLSLCDRVVVMARGGVMAFEGPPSEALEFFGTDTYDGIYDSLESRPSIEWHRQYRERAGQAQETAPPAAAERAESARPERARGGLLAQTLMLTGRYLKLLSRDRRNLLLLFGQAPILGAAGVGLFHSGLFNLVGGSAQDGIELLFLMALTTIWLGAIDGAREIIKERSVLERETAVGLRLSAYLVSKVVVLFAVVAIQVLLNAGILLIFRPLHESASVYLAIFLLLIVTGFAAVGMGLLISSLASSEDQSMTMLPLAIIPQLLFAGTIVTVARMAQPAKAISYLIFERWSLAGLGTQVGMNGRMAHDPQFARINPFGTHFFDLKLLPSVLIQLAFFAVFMAGVILLLYRRRRSPAS